MNETVAAWVRMHAWTDPVRAEAKHPGSILGLCLCLRPFTCAGCAGSHSRACTGTVFYSAETVIIGRDGWVYDPLDPERAARVWLTDRVCVQRCAGAPETDQVPVQLGLFGGAA